MLVSMIDAVSARTPPVKWEDRVLQYVRERRERRMRGLEHARRECKNKDKWTLLCHGYPQGGVLKKGHQIQRVDHMMML